MVFAQLTPERMRPRAVPEQCLNAILIASENLYQIGKIQNWAVWSKKWRFAFGLIM